MGLYAYCLLPAGRRPDGDLRGLENAPVEPVELDGLTAWISDLDRSPRPAIEAVRRHDRVIRAAMGGGATPLPLRFGQWFPSRERLAEELGGKREKLRRQLERVSGAVEFGVRIPDDEPEEDRAGAGRPESGTAYLEAAARRHGSRTRRRERAKTLAAELRDHLGDLVRDDALRELGEAGGGVELAHLVPEEVSDAYREKMAEYRPEAGKAGVRVTGPWPPYSFVERGPENERGG